MLAHGCAGLRVAKRPVVRLWLVRLCVCLSVRVIYSYSMAQDQWWEAGLRLEHTTNGLQVALVLVSRTGWQAAALQARE